MKQSDDILEHREFVVTETLMELEEELEQRLDNIPKGEQSLKQWNKDIDKLQKEINERLGYDKY